MQFRRVLEEGGYQAVHDHQDYVSGWHFLLGAGSLPPVRVAHVHKAAYQIVENYGLTRMRRLTALAGKHLVARFATHITGTSQQSMAEAGFYDSSFARTPKQALYCGFDVSRFAGDPREAKASVCRELDWPEDSKLILVAGRIDQSPARQHPKTHKNSGFALSIGIGCARRDPRVRMIFAGKPSSAVPALESEIDAAGMVGRIKFLGVRNDVHRLMLAADVLLFPSRGEGLGMVAVEAQASGLPVLASTAVPRECVVVPGLVRFLGLEAAVRQWALETLELADRPRDARAANQQVAASAFSIEHSAQAMVELYRGAM
jgi:glycosyltransferase involved in cell wall biosynthesis